MNQNKLKHRVLDLALYKDDRGSLKVLDSEIFPFEAKRLFIIEASKDGTKRGGHAHKECHQLLICIDGVVGIEIHNLEGVFTIELRENYALYLPPKNWCEILFFDNSTKVLVLASHAYDADDYIFEKP